MWVVLISSGELSDLDCISMPIGRQALSQSIWVGGGKSVLGQDRKGSGRQSVSRLRQALLGTLFGPHHEDKTIHRGTGLLF